MGYAADLWLEEVCAQVEALRLSFLYAENQQRNQNTVLLLVEAVGRVADATWLPMLRAWSAVETARVRGRLGAAIEGLESGAGDGGASGEISAILTGSAVVIP